MTFASAERIADTVLYEGYVLYPYRASAAKNRVRWQFGIVAPRAYSEASDAEPWFMQTEVLIAPPERAAVTIRVRCLQLQTRRVEICRDGMPDQYTAVESIEIDGRTFVTWDEGRAQAIDLPAIRVAELLDTAVRWPIAWAGGCDESPILDAAGARRGRTVHERAPLAADVLLAAERAGRALKLRVRIENTSPWTPSAGSTRDDALRHALIGAHTLLGVQGGQFVSLTDPPEDLAGAAAGCANRHTWPVLVGDPAERSIALSSPIILDDFPAVAPESPGDWCDGTEIDELLALRVMTLTDDEKREARATDERARRIVDRADSIPDAVLERLHGTVREFGGRPAAPGAASIEIDGATIARGARVRLRPSRRADSMDMFLAGRAATVAGVYRDFDDRVHVAVTIDDDPAAELHDWFGRYFYFAPEEIEPLGRTAGGLSGPPDRT